MKNITIVLLTMFALALLGVAVYQHGQIQALREEMAVPTSMTGTEAVVGRNAEKVPVGEVTVPGTEELAAERAQTDERIRELEARVESMRAVTESAAESRKEPGREKPGKGREKGSLTGFAEMLDNPGMKDMIRAQQKAQMDITHASLFKYLGLSAENLATFKELLVEKQMALMDAGLDMMKGTTDPDAVKDKQRHIAELSEDYDRRIKELLGEEDYDVYKDFEKTQPERQQVDMFKRTLAANDQLTETQEHDLIVAMHEERTSFAFTTDFHKQEEFDPLKLTDEAITRYMTELTDLQGKYFERAKDILSEAQLGQFKKNVEQQRAMQEMGMKMARQMFSGGKPAE